MKFFEESSNFYDLESSYWGSDIASCLPTELDQVVLVHISPLDLGVVAGDNVAVLEMPLTVTFWLIIVEVALEVCLIWIDPLAGDELSIFEGAHILHASVLEDVGALAVLFTILPLARVDVLILVNHNSLTMSVAFFPVTIVGADTSIVLLADTVLLVV